MCELAVSGLTDLTPDEPPNPRVTVMKLRLFVSLASLFVLSLSGKAMAGQYKQFEGDILIILKDPLEITIQHGEWWQGLAAPFATASYVASGVCEKARKEIVTAFATHQCYIDPEIAAYWTAEEKALIAAGNVCPVPAVVSCTSFDVGDEVWVLSSADSRKAARVTMVPGTYYGLRVHVQDHDALAIDRHGATAVGLGRALGVSVEGKVNAAIMVEVWKKMMGMKISFWARFE